MAIYIDFAQNSISYLCYIPELGTSESSPHVIFDEAREGPAIRKMYQAKNLNEIIAKI